jgi:osmotically-inducible protein OsmY
MSPLRDLPDSLRRFRARSPLATALLLFMKKLFAFIVAISLVGFVQAEEPANGSEQTTGSSEKGTDNTARNKRDKDGDTLTPEDQSNDANDIRITAAIRRAVVADEQLSNSAKNVKIITVGGVVTLRGTVDKESEVARVGALAEAVKGIGQVKNQLEVKKS